MSQLTLAVAVATAGVVDVAEAEGLATAEALPDGLASAPRADWSIFVVEHPESQAQRHRDGEGDRNTRRTTLTSATAPCGPMLIEHSIHLHLGVRCDAPGGSR
jgi:hypothetical protein